ncbi:MAG: VOC family protein [Terriglobales bacterium]
MGLSASKLRFFSGDCLCFATSNLPAAVEWYKEKLDCRAPRRDEMQDLEPDEPAAALLALPSDFPVGVYFYGEPAVVSQGVPVLFAEALEEVHEVLSQRGVVCTAIGPDRSGRAYFEFRDLDDNVIEVCDED